VIAVSIGHRGYDPVIAMSSREHGFTKMAEEHEQIARAIERRSAAGADEIAPGCARVASAMARGCGNARTKG
jgi:hypothetical protein